QGTDGRRPIDGRLTNTADRHVFFRVMVSHDEVSAGSKTGSQTSSRCSKHTCTGMPTCTVSGWHLTTLLISQRPRCSASSIMASTKGTLCPGNHDWKFTE